MLADGASAALLASVLNPAVLADGGPATLLAMRLSAAVLAVAAPAVLLAFRFLVAEVADGGPAALLASRLHPSVLAFRVFSPSCVIRYFDTIFADPQWSWLRVWQFCSPFLDHRR